MRTPGERIKAERSAKGWSQQDLADRISAIKKKKISRAAIAQWESGDSKSQKPENMFAAAKALGLSPQWILDETGEKLSAPYGADSDAKDLEQERQITIPDQDLIEKAAIDIAAESAEIARLWLSLPQDRREYLRRVLEDESDYAEKVKQTTSGDGGMQQNVADPLDAFKDTAGSRQTKREQKKESR